ncbi:MAG: mechanosensitive ion channel family protein [Thermoplasmata archaeon]
MILSNELDPFIFQIINFALVIIATYIITLIFKRIARRALVTTSPYLATVVSQYVIWAIWFVGLVVAVTQFNFQINTLLIFIGLLGAGFIVATKDILQSASIASFSKVYSPYKIGDVIEVKGYSGKVIEINIMNTIIITEKEELISIPNRLLLTEIFVNKTSNVGKEVAVSIVVDNKIDLPEFENEVLKSCHKVKKYLDQYFEPRLDVTQRGEKTTELALVFAVKTIDEKNVVIAEINQRIKEILDDMNKRKNKIGSFRNQ